MPPFPVSLSGTAEEDRRGNIDSCRTGRGGKLVAETQRGVLDMFSVKKENELLWQFFDAWCDFDEKFARGRNSSRQDLRVAAQEAEKVLDSLHAELLTLRKDKSKPTLPPGGRDNG